MKLRDLCKLSDGRDWWWENLGLALVDRTLLSKALIQLSADGWGCAPSLLVVWSEATQPLVGLMATSKRAYAKGDLPRLLLPVPPSLC